MKKTLNQVPVLQTKGLTGRLKEEGYNRMLGRIVYVMSFIRLWFLKAEGRQIVSSE